MTARRDYSNDKRNIRRDRYQAIWINLLEDLPKDMFETFKEGLKANPKLYEGPYVADVLATATEPTDLKVSMFKYREPSFAKFLDDFIEEHDIRFKKKRSFPIPEEEENLWTTLTTDYLKFYKKGFKNRLKNLHLSHPAARDLVAPVPAPTNNIALPPPTTFFPAAVDVASPTVSETEIPSEALDSMADNLASTPPQSPRRSLPPARATKPPPPPTDKKKSPKKRKERERDDDDFRPDTDESNGASSEQVPIKVDAELDKEAVREPPPKRQKLNDGALKHKFINDMLKTMQAKLDIIRSDVQEIVKDKLADDAFLTLAGPLKILKTNMDTLKQWHSDIQALINEHDKEHRDIWRLIRQFAPTDDH